MILNLFSTDGDLVALMVERNASCFWKLEDTRPSSKNLFLTNETLIFAPERSVLVSSDLSISSHSSRLGIASIGSTFNEKTSEYLLLEVIKTH